MYKEFKRSKLVGVFSENCVCHVRTSCGLPCAHEQALYLSECRSIPLSSIDIFWTKLDISPCISLECTDIGCDEEIQRFEATFKKESKSGKLSLLGKIRNLIKETTSSIREPVIHNTTRGRPSLKKKSFTKTIVDSPPQQPLARRYSNASTSSDVNLFGYREPARHSSYIQKEPKYSFPYNLPSLFESYITQLEDVESDGNCGFSAISLCLGNSQYQWPVVRMNLIEELQAHKQEYEIIFGNAQWVRIYNRLNFFRTDIDAPGKHWMVMPEMGILIASKYNVVLLVLSVSRDTTYLPLRSEPPPCHQHKVIAIAHVNDNHFVKVALSGRYPMPIITPYWNFYKQDCASGWAIPYQERINMYKQHFHTECNPESIII